MRPKLRVLGVVTDSATDVTGVETSAFDEVSTEPTSTLVDEPVVTPLVAAATSVSILNFVYFGRCAHTFCLFLQSPVAQNNETPSTPGSQELQSQTNSAGLASPQLGLGAMFVIGSLGAVIQLL